MIQQLIRRAGSRPPVLVQVTKSSVAVSVLKGTTPVTWAYRNGAIAEIPSDLAYVNQATFQISDFTLSNIGALFRAAAGQAGSEQSQMLQVVDYSGGQVLMAVSTNPESRTVFFDADGSLIPELDFRTPGGLATGLNEVVRDLNQVSQITIDSSTGIQVDYPGDDTESVRRQRTAKVPMTTIGRSEPLSAIPFNPGLVRPAILTELLSHVRYRHQLADDAAWTITIQIPDGASSPRINLSIGGVSVTADLAGNVIDD